MTCDIVIVTYNSADKLRECWLNTSVEANIIVVDNESVDGSAELAFEFADHVIRAENRGLSRSNNVGARSGSAPYILFCNPDVRISPVAVEKICSEIGAAGGLVAPQLVNVDGSKQPNGRRWPTPWIQVLRRLLPQSTRVQRYLWPTDHNLTVDWVTGACIGMSRETFDRIDGWPEEYFLYFEDVAMCRNARDRDVEIRLLDDIRVEHFWAQASRSPWSKATYWHIKSSLRYYLRSLSFRRMEAT